MKLQYNILGKQKKVWREFMQIKEIVNTIENDGTTVGYLSTYIRTFSCNLDCTYCDHDYCVNPESDDDLVGYTVMEVEETMSVVDNYGNNHVRVTGGEPLIQRDAPELVAALLEGGYIVNVETQGAVDLALFEDKMVDILSDDELVNNLIYTLDYKCPNSGESEKMISDNIKFLIENDNLNFVVDTNEDILFAKGLIDQYEPIAEVFILPNTKSPESIVDTIRANNIQKVRIQLPLRKSIYGDDMHD
jgi:7-carboxy-7-deazaguanine synthase